MTPTGRGTTPTPGRRRRRRPGRRGLAAAATLVAAAGLLTACGGDGGKPTLNWYINPDGQDTLAAIAADCSTDEYDVVTQLLPASATDQRTQLARRLAAEDSSTDLMSIDPVFVPEFANANWLLELPDDTIDDDTLQGAADTVVWEDAVYAAPQWANTQVLWYRRSLAQAAGLDMSQPVTWDQVIDAASAEGGTVGVQANQYEAYVVWINSLIAGAGGDIISDTEAGRDAQVDLDSEAGREAAAIVQKLAESPARQPDFTVSNEGTTLAYMYPADGGPGEFMTNWTFVYANYQGLVGDGEGQISQQEFDDLGWARYPQTVEGEESRPPIGGIEIGVGAYTDHPDFAREAALCVTDQSAQEQLAVNDGLMPSRASVYESDALRDNFPADLLELYRTSIDTGAPRPKSAFYNQISVAIQQQWHSPDDVNPDTTPQQSADFVRSVLEGRSLL
ncbi:extracellular solute-binding protein [Nocardioides sp. CFH 31398]|uniref:extracellular solute-binding protein n=1 Tax=Nocardioides sp. CFH 31398 TaxID=2919579 RepID=UPI001F058092|nr:extracellular solute-binding protein [Nocardioides sp. CFH 31398]MCH1868125.1 extracellular solute-binding protein [Nocardioides sp. CFH 31398]